MKVKKKFKKKKERSPQNYWILIHTCNVNEYLVILGATLTVSLDFDQLMAENIQLHPSQDQQAGHKEILGRVTNAD